MICIVVSFKKEIGYLLDLVKVISKKRAGKNVYYKCKLDDIEFLVVKSGLGKKSGYMDFKKFEGCNLLVSTGYCAALTEEIKNGDIVVSKRILSVDEKNYYSIIKGQSVDNKDIHFEDVIFSQKLIESFLENLAADELSLRIVTSFTSPKIVRNKQQKININKITGAEIAEMEDRFRFDFAKKLGIDFISIRVVLDEIVDDVPGFADGFKMGQRLTGILSKMDRASQSIAVAIEKFIRLINY